MSYVCEYCVRAFDDFYSLRAHQNGNRRDGVPHCSLRQNRSRVAQANRHTLRQPATASSASSVLAPITNPYDVKFEICRRHQDDSKLGPPQPLCNLGASSRVSYTGAVNYGEIVAAFHKYCHFLLQSRCKKFWRLFLKTRHLTLEDQTDILKLVCELFPIAGRRQWCVNKCAVRYLMSTKPFWPLVTYTYKVDLSEFRVPGLEQVEYKFLDPIFAWIIQARKLCEKYDLLFRYREARLRGERTWGSCVSCGQAMLQVKIIRYHAHVSFSGGVMRHLAQVSVSGSVMRHIHQVSVLGKYSNDVMPQPEPQPQPRPQPPPDP